MFRRSRRVAAAALALVAAWSSTPDATADSNDASSRRVAAAALTSGGLHTCVLLTDGHVRCWGLGGEGRLGYGDTADLGDDEPASAAGDVPLGGSALAVTAGNSHTCALMAAGGVRCWGDGQLGGLGYGNTDDVGDDEPPAVAGDVALGGSAVAVTAGDGHTCALLASGHVRCWGANYWGQLGYGHTQAIGDDEVPATAGNVPLGGLATAVAAGSRHTCALLVSGDVRCWGIGSYGKLGYGSTESIGDDETPASAGNVALGGKAVAITAGDEHTCALLASGDVRCWGRGASGQLGYGSTADIGDDETPVAGVGDVAVGGNATAITAGHFHTCALLVSGAVRCWGYGGYGQLGHGDKTAIGDDEPPSAAGDVPVGGGRVVAVSAGGVHTCALLSSGGLRCWGYALGGQLGHGNELQIGDDETPASTGNVPVGAPVRTRAPVRVTASATPLRDRRPPFVYALTGSVVTGYPTTVAPCSGRVTLTLRKGTRKIGTASAAVRPGCDWRGTVAVGRRPARSILARTRLTVTASYGGNADLLPATRVLRVTAR